MPDAQKPDRMGLAQASVAPRLAIYRDALGGTAHMREKAETYLPRFEMEEPKSYAKRLGEAVFYNATKLTLDALVGMVFATDPELSADLPAEIIDDWENIDLAGKHGAVWAKDFFRDTWDGFACIFVDMQRAPGARSRKEEDAAGLRPYWIPIRADQVLRARPIQVNGRTVVGSFAYHEVVVVEDGAFGERAEERVRDYRRTLTGAGTTVEYRIYAKGRDEKDRDSWTETESGVMSIDEIPVVPCYTNPDARFFAADPPLLDLACENIDHYQQRSEHRQAWKYARVPIQVYPGMEPDQVVIAPDRGITTPTPEAKPYYMETSGRALEGSKEELQECERRMAMLGASMLYNATRSAQTATAERIQKAEGNSRLSTAARALQDALEGALALHARWRGLKLPTKTEGRWITVNRDFEKYELDAQQIAALDNAVGNGNLTLDSFLTALRDGVPVLSFLDPEREAALLMDGEGMRGMGGPAPLDDGDGSPQPDTTAERERRLEEAERKINALLQTLDPELAKQLREAA